MSVFLISNNYVNKLKDDLSNLQNEKITLPNKLKGVIYVCPSQPVVSKWLSEVDAYIDNSNHKLTANSQSTGAVIVASTPNNTFAICFGTGWLRINDDYVVADFGRIVALNSIPPEKVVELKSEQVFAKHHITNERAPSASSRKNFGVDYDRDLLGVVEGIPSNAEKLSGKIRGGTSLKINSELTELADILSETEKLYSSINYKTHWPEVDNISIVHDADTLSALDKELDDAIQKNTWPSSLMLTMWPSKDGSDETVDRFCIGQLPRKTTKASRTTAPYLLPGSWDTWLKRVGLTRSIDTAKETVVHGLNSSEEPVLKTTIYHCMAYHFSTKNSNGDVIEYLFTQGRWYKANSDYIRIVNFHIDNLRKSKSAKTLPQWNAVDSEGTYNIGAANHIAGILLDAKNIHYGGGQSKFEFCDILDTSTKTLYFAKIAENSSHISHLVEQVRRTTELFFNSDSTYRSKLKNAISKTNASASNALPSQRPMNGDWNLCIVVLGRSLDKLPFFAKCGIYRLIKELAAAGHKLQCCEC